LQGTNCQAISAAARVSGSGVGHTVMYQNGARLRIAACAAVVALVSIGLSGCSSTSKSGGGSAGSHINTKTKFSSDEYGVGASPQGHD
jgi:hypothetical protein